jgi:hypothetical protein
MARPVYSVTVKDTASDYLARLARGLEAQEYGEAVGRAGVRALENNFRDKDQDPQSHRTARDLGASPSGLYAQMVKHLSHSTTREGVLLSINHAAAAQRYFGGTITPTGGRKYLTIPAIAEAYGVKATDAPVGLEPIFAWSRSEGRARVIGLRQADAKPKKGRRFKKRAKDSTDNYFAEKGAVWYWLVESVTQRPDPTVLPDDSVLASHIINALAGWVEDI